MLGLKIRVMTGYFKHKFEIFSTGRDHQLSRKYPRLYKSVMALRLQIRSSGFLVGYNSSDMPFYSSDLKQVSEQIYISSGSYAITIVCDPNDICLLIQDRKLCLLNLAQV